ncbi:MAG TPA: protein ndvB, partial [Longimicrobium sp.]|nr:protein ndvB [Longimicrobium sp.]
ATNRERGEFSERVAFASVVAPVDGEVSWTADRAAFLGAHGSAERPRALRMGARLDGAAGAGLDPCAAFPVPLTLAPGESADVAFLLGEAADGAAARVVLGRYRSLDAIDRAHDEVRAFWSDLVSGVQVRTPSPEIDLVVNGWLAYQNLACRVWGRTAFYQSGGAYGFRDQLQDSSALVYLRPELTRRQIVLHASHQFVEGDVLHWWHPPLSKGIRTRFADDLLWLPYITAFYLGATGDASVLDERAGFVTARQLEPGEDEVFLVPESSGQEASVYEHCCMTIDRSLTRGAHGLPLMGTGDWNDGMNRVGREGRGESVWLGFFLHSILDDFIPLCEARGDSARVERYRAYRAELAAALNDGGWDGGWYRRAYYDNGAPLGSAANDECRIDAIAQAWAVLSGVAPEDRAEQALDALEEHLVSEREGIIRLLTPAFDRTPHDPGYIKGYLPGVRENGGQYTHGALWAVRALAKAGRRERAARLLAMLSPVSHGRTAEETAVYQAEPYVVAADVYGVAPHVGRGGWTWYTGSAGWMFRVALESVLGVTLEGGRFLRIAPCVPAEWPGYTVTWRHPGGGTYEIAITQRGGDEGIRATLDGRE